MRTGVPLAWLQMTHERWRLLAAIAGIAFAVILMLMQLGFEDALMSSAGTHLNHMVCDVALVSPQYEFLHSAKTFPERRLYQALAVPGVRSVEPVYVGQAPWKNPWTRQERTIMMVGFPPRPGVFSLDGVDQHISELRQGDRILFDDRARPEFGPVGREVKAGRPVITEVASRRVEVVGMFALGTSFGVDGTILLSDRDFFRILPYRSREAVSIGLVLVQPGFDPAHVRDRIAQLVGGEVQVLTHDGLVNLERTYWSTNTPVGFVFKLGLAMGLFVGAIIVYQILYTDVSDHLGEYATLKALGYRDRYLFGVVLQESAILSFMGFIPGLGLSLVLYILAARATMLPLNMPLERVVLVYALTLLMCIFSGALAMRKLRQAAPAEIF